MGLVHAATVRTHPDVEIAAFCDTSKFMVDSLKTFFPGARFFEDYRSMLGEIPLDVVFITTPSGSHAAIAGHCAAAGKHVFVEKPLATTMEEATAVAEAVTQSRIRSQVGYVCRYAPTFEKAREILHSGAIGRVVNFASVKYSSDVTRRVEKSWRFMRKSPQGGGGGVVNEFACHGIDLLVWFFGEPESVSARMESWYSAEVEDYVHAAFVYDGFSGWIDSSWSMQDYRKPYNRIEVTGDNGKLIVTDSELRWFVRAAHAGNDAGWFSTNITELYRPVRIFVGDIMFTRQADDFLASVRGGAESRSPAPDALCTQRVLEAIRGSGVR
jgi:predicted dehydrogenase